VRFNIAWNASRAEPMDLGALPIVAARLHIYAVSDPARIRVVCEASASALIDEAAWQSFRNALNRAALSSDVLAVVDDPVGGCAMGPRPLAAQPDAVLSKPL
jgi:hypothetical protein